MAVELGSVIADALPNLNHIERRAVIEELNFLQKMGRRLGGGQANFSQISADSIFLKTLPLTGARVNRTTDQTIPDSTQTKVEFDNVDFDDADIFDQSGYFSSSENTKLTVPPGQDGLYLIGGRITWSVIATTKLAHFSIIINNNSVVGRGTQSNLRGQGDNSIVGNTGVDLLDLASGDYIEMRAFHTSGGDETINPAIMWILRVR